MLGFSLKVNFDYLTYEAILGGLAWFTGISVKTIFFSSFYWGKVVLLAALVYLLKSLKLTQKIIFFALFFLAVFTGTGSAHGFFWVVPAFWFFVSYLFMLAIYFDSKTRPKLLIGMVVLMGVFTHKLSLPMLFSWIILEILMIKKRYKLPNRWVVILCYFLPVVVLVDLLSKLPSQAPSKCLVLIWATVSMKQEN